MGAGRGGGERWEVGWEAGGVRVPSCSTSRRRPTQVESGFPPGIISHCLPSFSARPCFPTQWSSDILNGANNGMKKTS